MLVIKVVNVEHNFVTKIAFFKFEICGRSGGVRSYNLPINVAVCFSAFTT